MAIRLVTDSTADLPPELVERWKIEVVPLYVNFIGNQGEDAIETLKDGVDIDPDRFYRRLVESDVLPTTSQPSLQDFLEVYKRLTEDGDEIVSVHISSKLSGTYNSAIQAKEGLNGDARVEVVDSELASMGAGMAVLAGARAAEKGADIDTVLQEVGKAASELRIYFMVDTLEYLQKGGRIGKAQAFLGTLLGIKPILSLQEGEMHPLERVRTRRRAIQRLATIVEDLAPITELCVIHSTTPEDMDGLKASLSHLLPQDQIISTRLGPVVGAHVGPGLIGVAARSAS